jgi:hypothetical protein
MDMLKQTELPSLGPDGDFALVHHMFLGVITDMIVKIEKEVAL